jgi:hypothetical protein
LISGTPTSAGTANLTIVVTDSYGGRGTRAIAITIHDAPALSLPDPLASGELDVAYRQSLPAPSGGSGGWVWSASGLPDGISIVPSTGELDGTALKGGTYRVVVKVTDRVGGTASQTTSLAINGKPDLSSSAGPGNGCGHVTLADAENNVSYGAHIVPAGAQTQVAGCGGAGGGYHFSVVGGKGGGLPTNLHLDKYTGQIYGTPQVAGLTSGSETWPFTIEVGDPSGATQIENEQITVYAQLQFDPTCGISNGSTNGGYYWSSGVSGVRPNTGYPTYTWSSTLSWASIFQSGQDTTSIGGTAPNPNPGTTYTFSVTDQDALGGSATGTCEVYVSYTPPPTTTTSSTTTT